jgi:hypothetical protein
MILLLYELRSYDDNYIGDRSHKMYLHGIRSADNIFKSAVRQRVNRNDNTFQYFVTRWQVNIEHIFDVISYRSVALRDFTY